MMSCTVHSPTDSLVQPTCILVYIECNSAPGGSPFELSLGLRSSSRVLFPPSPLRVSCVVVCPRFCLGSPQIGMTASAGDSGLCACRIDLNLSAPAASLGRMRSSNALSQDVKSTLLLCALSAGKEMQLEGANCIEWLRWGMISNFMEAKDTNVHLEGFSGRHRQCRCMHR